MILKSGFMQFTFEEMGLCHKEKHQKIQKQDNEKQIWNNNLIADIITTILL